MAAAMHAYRSETTELIVMPAGPLPAVQPAPDSLAGMLLNLPDPRQEQEPSQRIERWEWGTCWSAVAPSHRDLIAAYLLRPRLRSVYEGVELPFLAEADGPVGPGISLAIAGGLGAEEETSRGHRGRHAGSSTAGPAGWRRSRQRGPSAARPPDAGVGVTCRISVTIKDTDSDIRFIRLVQLAGG